MAKIRKRRYKLRPKVIKRPDDPKTGPKGRRTTSRRKYVRTFYDIYKEYQKQTDKENRISKELFNKIFEQFSYHVYMKIIYENYNFVMPHKTGVVYVKAWKHSRKSAPINWKPTLEKRKVYKYTNQHTFGHVFGIFWCRENVNWRNARYYRWRPAQKFPTNEVSREILAEHIIRSSKDPYVQSYIKL